MSPASTTPTGPLVVACLRAPDLRPEVDPLTGAIARDRLGVGLAAAEAAALEHALRVADAWTGRVLALVAGPPAADAVLRDARSLGADVLRVAWPPTPVASDEHVAPDELETPAEYVADLLSDERPLARAIAAAIREVGEPALVLCGDRSADRGTGALPAFLAHELGAAQALGLVELRVEGDAIGAVRRLDGGRRERLLVKPPAVCSVEGAGVRLRRGSLPMALAAAGAPVRRAEVSNEVDAAPELTIRAVHPYRPRTRLVPPPAGSSPRERLLALTGALVAHDPPTIVGPLEAAAAVDVLLQFLGRNGFMT